jgi:hypothetical protein
MACRCHDARPGTATRSASAGHGKSTSIIATRSRQCQSPRRMRRRVEEMWSRPPNEQRRAVLPCRVVGCVCLLCLASGCHDFFCLFRDCLYLLFLTSFHSLVTAPLLCFCSPKSWYSFCHHEIIYCHNVSDEQLPMGSSFLMSDHAMHDRLAYIGWLYRNAFVINRWNCDDENILNNSFVGD